MSNLSSSARVQVSVDPAAKKRVIVIGNGMVGHRFCERMVELDRDGRFVIAVIGEEPQAAYDRVHLSDFLGGRGAAQLALTTPGWYAEQGIDLQLGCAVRTVNRTRRCVVTVDGRRLSYDALVFASGSQPFVVPIPGVERSGVFVYRTIDHLRAIRHWARHSKRAAVIGGGLLGLEAAKAVVDLGLEAHVIESADRLMPRQLDRTAAELLRASVEALGVVVHIGARTEAIEGDERVRALRFVEGSDLAVDMVILSAGIRPRDELARACDLAVGPRGGIEVNDCLETTDPDIFAIGECVRHRGVLYGLVAPGYEMAEVLARRMNGEDVRFAGADQSAKLKLLGVEVASFGHCFADLEEPGGTRVMRFEDHTRRVYQKLVFDREVTRLLGGMLVGDAARYIELQTCAEKGAGVPEDARELLFGAGSAPRGPADLPDGAPVCSCNNVTKGDLVAAVKERSLTTLGDLKKATRAATGCGGCQPVVVRILEAELARMGQEVSRHLCQHFAYSRQDLFWIVKINRIEGFDRLLKSYGRGDGCEVCRPAVASILAATWNDLVLRHADIQDTNDRFLANIQRGGTYSVIPRVPGGEITADKLIVLGEVAKKYDLYCKITGGQRIDLLGARVEQLPEIWETLVAAGFESGHAYGKAMRTVKSCIGSTWCRYGVQDSTTFAIRVEERYRGIRAPHKLKSAVSGCVRECAEAQNKDFGIIATEKGWNVYLCGNGGSNPRHGDLFVTDVSDDEVIRILDRFIMFYIQTARPLQRTARWLEELEGGIDKLKEILLDDALGICAQLEADMQKLVDSYACEWKAVVESPELRAKFRHFADRADQDENVRFIRERAQKRPVDWPHPTPGRSVRLVPDEHWNWRKLARVGQFSDNGAAAVRYGDVQLAIYNFSRRGEWYATQAMCPHRRDNVLPRGLLGDQSGEPKVACPMHKKTFSLTTGKCLNDSDYEVNTFPVEIRGDEVWVKLPPADVLRQSLACPGSG